MLPKKIYKLEETALLKDLVNRWVKTKIENIKLRHIQATLEILQSLSGNIEDRLEKEYIQYLTYVCTQKSSDKDSWKNVWESYNEYQEDKSKLSFKATEYLNQLLISIRY